MKEEGCVVLSEDHAESIELVKDVFEKAEAFSTIIDEEGGARFM